jgi:hypothetical protein
MTTPRTVADFGAPKENAVPVADPQKYVSAREYGRLVDDVAQMSCTSPKAWVRFPTALANGVVTPAAGGSQMGAGILNLPAVARTGVGIYTVIYPASWTDNSGILNPDGTTAPGATEDIIFSDSHGAVRGSAAGLVQTSENASVVTVYVFDTDGVPSDLGGNVGVRVEAR